MGMTDDIIRTRRQYHIYCGSIISCIAHLFCIDRAVDEMKFDDMLEARQLMDEKIPLWKL